MKEPLITLRGVEKRFDGAVAVSDFNLDVSQGEFVSFIGPSGCGKSTVLRIIAGLDQPTSGQLIIHRQHSDGRRSDGSEDEPRQAFVFQDASLLPWRHVVSNVELPLELAGVPASERRDRVEPHLRRVGLSPADDHKLPRMLSGGMKMRVSLARALVTEPDIMLMDEPFGALDDILRMELNDELMTLWERFAWTTLFVTHQVSEAVYMSDRVVVMSPHPGRIKDVIEIDLPRPRQVELRGTAEFARLTLHLQQLLREPVHGH